LGGLPFCICCYSDFGFLTVSSIDSIVQAASQALDNALNFTSVGSQMNFSYVLQTPSYELISTPNHFPSSPRV